MNRTDIEYLTHTWNPFAMRCSRISDGCKNCWHMRYAERLAHCPSISFEKKMAYAGMANPILDQVEVQAPMKMKKPARIGVQFMGDIFHKSIKFCDVLSVVNVISACEQHQFFMLTKRVERMVEFFRDYAPPGPYLAPKNLWAGISVENQATADERLCRFTEILAWHKWISVEPLLAPVDLSACLEMRHMDGRRMIDWVIVGCETGPNARPFEMAWKDSLQRQCDACGVPLYDKNGDVANEWPKGLK